MLVQTTTMLIDSDDFCIPSSFEEEKSEMHNSGWTRRHSYIVLTLLSSSIYAWPWRLLWIELLINGWVFILVNELDQFWHLLYKALTKNRMHRFYSVLHRPSNNTATPNMLCCLTFSFDIITIIETCSELELVLSKKELEFSRLHV